MSVEFDFTVRSDFSRLRLSRRAYHALVAAVALGAATWTSVITQLTDAFS